MIEIVIFYILFIDVTNKHNFDLCSPLKYYELTFRIDK